MSAIRPAIIAKTISGHFQCASTYKYAEDDYISVTSTALYAKQSIIGPRTSVSLGDKAKDSSSTSAQSSAV